MPDLSVVVSTYNRESDIDNLLTSLSRQKLNRGDSWEVVISNNGSTDNTEKVIQKYSDSTSVPIRYLYQPRNAKSYGLNAALSNANGKIIAFTDDDIILPENWVDAILEYFKENPDTSCIGGPVILYNKEDLETSTRNSQEYAVHTKKNFNPVYIPIIGCNMIFKRPLIDTIGSFDTRLSPGSYIGCSEDLDYIYRVLHLGYTIEYVPTVFVHHNHGRNSLNDLKKIKKRYMIGRGAFYAKYSFKDRMVLRWAYWEFRSLFINNWYRWVFKKESRINLSYLFWLLVGFVKWQFRFLDR